MSEATNSFKTVNATITGAQYKSKIRKVVITLDEGAPLFIAPIVVNNVVGYKLDPVMIQMIAKSEITYSVSIVKAGESYTWSKDDMEVNVADKDLRLVNLEAVVLPIERALVIMDRCEAMASQASWDEAVMSKAEKEAAKLAEEANVPEGAEENYEDEEVMNR